VDLAVAAGGGDLNWNKRRCRRRR